MLKIHIIYGKQGPCTVTMFKCRFGCTVEVCCKIVDFKIWIIDAKSKLLALKPSRPLPKSSRVFFRDMIISSGHILPGCT